MYSTTNLPLYTGTLVITLSITEITLVIAFGHTLVD